MSTPTPPSLVKAFATSGDRNAIPVVPSATPGAASYNLGFPPLTMTDPEEGGIPPDGKDMNGALYDVSAHIAWMAAGGAYPWNADVITYNTGYAIGAIIRSAVSLSTYFYNTLANNVNNPDSVTTGWISFSPVANPVGLQTTVLAPGTTSDLALTAGTGFLDLNPTTGDATLTGIAAGTNGQQIIVSNVNASWAVTVNSLDGSSMAANRIRLPANLSILQYSNITLQYSTALALWVPAS